MPTSPHIPVRLLALSGLLCGLVGTAVDDAQAAAISIGAFGLDAVVESFEGLAPGPNIPLLFARSVVLKRGVSGTYTFASGVTLTACYPTSLWPLLRAWGAEISGWDLRVSASGRTAWRAR